MLRIQQGDLSAFENVVRAWERKLFALAFRVIGDAEEARDVIQDVFIKLWEAPSAWNPRKGGLGTYLYRVVMNRSLNRVRWLNIKNRITGTPLDEVENQILDKADNPEKKVIAKELVDKVAAAFRSLPAKQRAALHLRYWERMALPEIANTLGVTVRAVESLLFRGRIGLKERMGHYWN